MCFDCRQVGLNQLKRRVGLSSSLLLIVGSGRVALPLGGGFHQKPIDH